MPQQADVQGAESLRRHRQATPTSDSSSPELESTGDSLPETRLRGPRSDLRRARCCARWAGRRRPRGQEGHCRGWNGLRQAGVAWIGRLSGASVARRSRWRQHLDDPLAWLDELVLLPGEARDLCRGVQRGSFLGQRAVLRAQVPELGRRRAEGVTLREERRGREPGHEHDGGEHDRAGQEHAAPSALSGASIVSPTGGHLDLP